MRRSASETIRNLEMRIARLEKQSSWDEPRNYNHPAMQAVRDLEGTKLLGFELEESFSGAIMWSNGDDEIYITYDGPKTTFVFTQEDEYGTPTTVGAVNIGRGGNDPVESDFLKASKKVLRSL
jgi:hypothetical protein